MTTKVAVIGAGKMGEMICTLLLQSGDYEVALVDKSAQSLAPIPDQPGLHKVCMDVGETEAFDGVLAGCFAVLSACPYYLTVAIARAALRAGIHYLDLTEDVASTRQVKALAEGAPT